MGKAPKSDNRVATVLAGVITTAWAVSFIVDIIVKPYDPPASIHALMMMVAGAVFGEGLLNVRGNGNGGTTKKKESDDG